MADNVKTVSVRMKVDGYEDAKLKIEKLSVEAEKFGKEHPEITPQINAQKALLEARLLRDGIKKELSKVTMDVGTSGGGRGGIFSRLLGGSGLGPGGGSGVLSGLDSASGPLGISLSSLPAILPAVGALLVEAGGLVAGFAAATAGVAAFGAVAMPTFQKLTGDISALHNANESFQQSALRVDTAIKTSAADAALYNSALKLMPPGLASAAKLLGDQNVRWQDLTKSQQNNVTALANNKAALKLLLPSQQTALTALLSAKTAWDDMNPAQQKAATSLNQLSNGYQKIVTALQPDVFKVFNAGLKVATNLLPALQPLAQAGASAISGLLGQVAKFTQSKGFKDWLSSFEKLAGPSITAIGKGIGGVIVAVGKLIGRFSPHDAAHAINVFFDPIIWAINTLSDIIGRLMRNWDQLSSGMAKAWHAIVRATDVAVTAILNSIGQIINGAAKAFGWIPGIGPALKRAAGDFSTFEGQVTGALAGISGAAASTSASLAAVGYAAVNAFNKSKLVPTAGNAVPHAAGGPASGLIMTGEMGRELLSVPPGSYVYNHQQTEAMMSGRSGGATYNVTVNALVADRNTGRLVVDAIRKFEEGSGHGWRK